MENLYFELAKLVLPEGVFDLFDLISFKENQGHIIISLDEKKVTPEILDRLLYRCEVVKMTGQSYRMENRKTIFEPAP